MRVRNLNGTRDNVCACGSWIDHWERFSGETALFCAAQGCPNLADVGAHVRKAAGGDDRWYIIPLCRDCNMRRGDIDIEDGTVLVSANRAETCAKKAG